MIKEKGASLAQMRVYLKLAKMTKENHGIPPTVREVMDAMHFNSPQSIRKHLIPLAKAGFIDWSPGKARGMRPLKEVSICRGCHRLCLKQNQRRICRECQSKYVRHHFEDKPWKYEEKKRRDREAMRRKRNKKA